MLKDSRETKGNTATPHFSTIYLSSTATCLFSPTEPSRERSESQKPQVLDILKYIYFLPFPSLHFSSATSRTKHSLEFILNIDITRLVIHTFQKIIFSIRYTVLLYNAYLTQPIHALTSFAKETRQFTIPTFPTCLKYSQQLSSPEHSYSIRDFRCSNLKSKTEVFKC